MKDEKKPHGVQLLIRAVVRGPDGKIISDTGQKPSKSFVLQLLQYIRGLFDGIDVYAKDVTGAAPKIIDHDNFIARYFRMDAPINDSGYGLVIGTGIAPEDNADYKLDTQLTEGVGLGNITHGAMVMGDAAVVGVNVDLEYKRAFTNNTGLTITVAEAGAYTRNQQDTKYHCILRDVLAATVEVPDKCSLTIYYTYRTTV